MTKKELRKRLEEKLLKTTHCYQEVPFIVDAVMDILEEYEKDNQKN
ncbi:MAG: hypothetical protein AABY22_28590 [Nanoarchaeota archaeon]